MIMLERSFIPWTYFDLDFRGEENYTLNMMRTYQLYSKLVNIYVMLMRENIASISSFSTYLIGHICQTTTFLVKIDQKSHGNIISHRILCLLI